MFKVAGLASGTYLVLGLRNLRRHPRRTLLILGSLLVGFAALTLLGALHHGLSNDLKENIISILWGHIQVHAKGFEMSQQIQHHMPDPAAVIHELTGLPEVAAWSPRVRTSGLASVAAASAGVQILGIDSVREARLSRLAQCVVSGTWLSAVDARGLLLGKRLVETLGVGLGDKVILIAQAPSGEMVSELFRLRGVLQAGVPEVDWSLAVVALPAAQRMLALDQGVTDIVIRATRHDVVDALWDRLRAGLPAQDYEVMRWSDISPLVQQRLELADMFTYFLFLIVMVVVVAEILNVMLIALHERTREFGLMEALGTRKGQIFTMILWESVLLVMSGCLGGYLLGALLALYLRYRGIDLSSFTEAITFVYFNPVLRPVLTWRAAVHIIGTTFVAALLAALYPAWKATRVRPVEAIRHL